MKIFGTVTCSHRALDDGQHGEIINGLRQCDQVVFPQQEFRLHLVLDLDFGLP